MNKDYKIDLFSKIYIFGDKGTKSLTQNKIL